MEIAEERASLLEYGSRPRCYTPPVVPLKLTAGYRYSIAKTRTMAVACITVLAVYIVVSVLFYRHVESFSTFRALYFCVITFTTVGFGDFKPSSSESKLFTCLFVFCGLAIIASVIAWLLEYLIEEREVLRINAVHNDFDVEDNVDSISFALEIDGGHMWPTTSCPTIPTYSRDIVLNMFISLLKVIAIVTCGTLCYMFVFDSHSLVDALYLSCMTVSTVGYGDIAPSNDLSRGFTIMFALVGSTLTASALSSFTGALSALNQAMVQKAALNAVLTLDSLVLMDADRNNAVSKAEFVLYKLRVMGLVDEDIVRRAEAQFEKLDMTKDGELTANDVVAFQERLNMAKTKLAHS